MAWIETGRVTTEPERSFQGYSTETKPSFATHHLTDYNSGSTALELDTKKVYVWHINAWVEL